MTVTNHTALYRFTFEELSHAPMIFVDLIDLPQTRSNGTATVDPDTGRLSGTGTFEPRFGIGNYDLHFCVDFHGAKIFDTGVFVNNRAGNEPKTVHTINDGGNDDKSLSAGASTQFDKETTSVIARVGLSFISVEKACSNAQNKIPAFDFEAALQTAQNAWEAKLSAVSVDPNGVSTKIQTVWWNALYRTMLSPQDYTGENPLWESDEPYYDSYYWQGIGLVYVV
jgi:putative alpha-1,2-mannosidase